MQRMPLLHSRRGFLKDVAGASAGIFFTSCCGLVDSAMGWMQSPAPARRREVVIGGRRALTVDIHTHVIIPEALEIAKAHTGSQQIRNQLASAVGPNYDVHNADSRVARMDREGIDVQAVSANPWWYWAERSLAREIVQATNEQIAKLCAAHPDRFVGFAAVALQHPDMAAEQLEEGMKNLGMRGCAIAGSVNGEELSAPKFHPFWAKAEQLGALVFMHPQGFLEARERLQGNGWLTNVIGQPLETTVALSHLIFEGTLDRFPGLKICAAHAGGFLPSYIGRSDACLTAQPDNCKPVQKKPSEYLRHLYFDSLVFNSEGLRHLVAVAGSNQVVLGTDSPTQWNPRGVDHILETPGLSDDDRRAILGGNAAKLLRMDLPPRGR